MYIITVRIILPIFHIGGKYMKKYIISSLTIIVFISIFVSIPNKDNKIISELVKNDTLAFTVDGKSVNEMPKKVVDIL